MAHKKGQGSSRNGRDSNAQRRGIKRFAGERVRAGNILVRQLGTRIHPGRNVGLGRDYTLFALVDGTLHYERFGKDKKRARVEPIDSAADQPSIDQPAIDQPAIDQPAADQPAADQPAN